VRCKLIATDGAKHEIASKKLYLKTASWVFGECAVAAVAPEAVSSSFGDVIAVGAKDDDLKKGILAFGGFGKGMYVFQVTRRGRRGGIEMREGANTSPRKLMK
jgi:hypothetical protein